MGSRGGCLRSLVGVGLWGMLMSGGNNLPQGLLGYLNEIRYEIAYFGACYFMTTTYGLQKEGSSSR